MVLFKPISTELLCLWMQPKLAGQQFPSREASCEQLTKPDTHSTYFHYNCSSYPLTCKHRRVLTNWSEAGAKSTARHWASKQRIACVKAFCEVADHSPGPADRTWRAVVLWRSPQRSPSDWREPHFRKRILPRCVLQTLCEAVSPILLINFRIHHWRKHSSL